MGLMLCVHLIIFIKSNDFNKLQQHVTHNIYNVTLTKFTNMTITLVDIAIIKNNVVPINN